MTLFALIQFLQAAGWKVMEESGSFIKLKPPHDIGAPRNYFLHIPANQTLSDYDSTMEGVIRILAGLYGVYPVHFAAAVRKFTSSPMKKKELIRWLRDEISFRYFRADSREEAAIHVVLTSYELENTFAAEFFVCLVQHNGVHSFGGQSFTYGADVVALVGKSPRDAGYQFALENAESTARHLHHKAFPNSTELGFGGVLAEADPAALALVSAANARIKRFISKNTRCEPLQKFLEGTKESLVFNPTPFTE